MMGSFSINNLLKGSSIKNRAMRGSAALAAGAMFQRMLRLGRTMVLARLLLPDDFGVIAIIMMAIVMLESVTDSGVRLSIIQNKDGSDSSYLNTAWWFQAARGVGLYLVSFLVAPFVAAFYENPGITDMLRVAFLSILVSGVISPRVHLLEREFKFGKWTVLEQAAGLIGTIITIAMVFYLRNVWGLVVGNVIERFIYVFLTFVLYPFRPSFELDRKSLTELFRFARGIFGLSAMNLVARQADVFALGKVVAPAILGSYYLALQLAEQINSLFSSMVFPVLLPSFASMKDNVPLLKNTLMSVNRSLAVLCIPISVFISINSAVILSIIYGDRYVNAAIALSILSISMFIRMQNAVLSQIDIGMGRPHFLRNQSLKRTTLIVILMYPAARFAGLVGAALVMITANIAMLFFQLNSVRKVLDLKVVEYLGKWSFGLGLGILVLIPNIFIFAFKMDSIAWRLGLSITAMIAITLFGFINIFKKTAA